MAEKLKLPTTAPTWDAFTRLVDEYAGATQQHLVIKYKVSIQTYNKDPKIKTPLNEAFQFKRIVKICTHGQRLRIRGNSNAAGNSNTSSSSIANATESKKRRQWRQYRAMDCPYQIQGKLQITGDGPNDYYVAIREFARGQHTHPLVDAVLHHPEIPAQDTKASYSLPAAAAALPSFLATATPIVRPLALQSPQSYELAPLITEDTVLGKKRDHEQATRTDSEPEAAAAERFTMANHLFARIVSRLLTTPTDLFHQQLNAFAQLEQQFASATAAKPPSPSLSNSSSTDRPLQESKASP